MVLPAARQAASSPRATSRNSYCTDLKARVLEHYTLKPYSLEQCLTLSPDVQRLQADAVGSARSHSCQKQRAVVSMPEHAPLRCGSLDFSGGDGVCFGVAALKLRIE